MDEHIVFKLARGPAAVLNSYAGPAGEVLVDLTNASLRVQTGAAGGSLLCTAAQVGDTDIDLVAIYNAAYAAAGA